LRASPSRQSFNPWIYIIEKERKMLIPYNHDMRLQKLSEARRGNLWEKTHLLDEL
jgi:hypothetical protein